MSVELGARAVLALAGLAAVLWGLSRHLRAGLTVNLSAWRRVGLSKQLAAAFGGTRDGRGVTFTHGDATFRCEAFANGRFSPAYVEVECWSAPSVRFVITKATWTSRITRRSTGASTGDPELDATLVIGTDDPIAVGAFLRDPARCAALRAIFALDPSRLEQDDARIRVRWPLRMTRAALIERIRSALDPMTRLVVAAPSAAASAEATRRDRAARRLRLLTRAAASLAFALCFIADKHYPLLAMSEMVHDGFPYVAPLALGTAIWLRRSGRSSRGRTLSPFATFVVVLLAALGLAMLVNGAGDSSPATVHDARVVHHDPSSRDESHYVEVESWRGSRTEKIYVARALQQCLEQADRMRVVTRPGRLGYEWVVSYGLPDDSG